MRIAPPGAGGLAVRLKCGRASVAADGEVFTISPGGGKRLRVCLCVCGFRALIGRLCVCVAEVTATAALLNTDVNMGGGWGGQVGILDL